MSVDAESFNIGNEIDLSLALDGQVFTQLGLIEEVDQKVNSKALEATPINLKGYTVRRTTYQGYTYEFKLTRVDDTFDDLVDAVVANFHALGPEPIATATETKISGGNASIYALSVGTFEPGSLGTWKGSEKVDGITFTIHFQKRSKVAGPNLSPWSPSGTAALL
jgi:hypothetical protein